MYKVFFVIIVLVVVGYYLAPKYFPLLFSRLEGRYYTATIDGEIFKLEIADTEQKRTKGLSVRNEMASDEGMIFVFNTVGMHGIVMTGMKFPLDVIWLRGKKVVDIAENLQPDNSLNPKVYYPNFNADTVIEVNAGTVEKLGLKVNDHLS